MPVLSVVLPAYESEGCIEELTTRLKYALEEITPDFEVIFVEDAGRDGSWHKILHEVSRDQRIKGIRLCRNFGQHHALTAGMDHAEGDWVVLMDCDLQDVPEEIPNLYRKALEGYDVVLAKRQSRKDSRLNALTSKLFYRAFDVLTDTQSDPSIGTFRIMSSKVARAFRQMKEQQRFLGGMMQWLGFSTATIDVPRPNRFEGSSTYTFGKRMRLAMNAMVSFSNKPLILSVRLGFLICLLSALVAAFVIYRKLFLGINLTGWASVMVSLYFLGGLIIMNLGVVGLYVGKVFDQTKARPLYIIDEKSSNFETTRSSVRAEHE